MMTNIASPAKTTFAQLVLFSMLLILIPRFDAQGATSPPQVAGGGEHTCVLIDGGVQCWGRNHYGQLGDGTNTDSNVPLNVAGLTVGVAAISTQVQHTCALMNSGGVKCWGRNLEGQLGNGTTINSNVPVDVTNLSTGVSEIATGSGHSCALMLDGELRCWGSNQYGKLGDGTTISRSTPVAVAGLPDNGTKLALGAEHSCALMENGGVACWGRNYYGQLGEGTGVNSATPVGVTGLSNGVSTISASGWHTCIIMNDGGAKCWGWNWRGQLGDNTTVDRNTPVDVSGLSDGVTKISTGDLHTCAATDSRDGLCWGDNFYGQLGDNSSEMRLTPTRVNGLADNVVTIVAGGLHSCAFTSNIDLSCWGANRYGQIGDGTNIRRSTPSSVVWPPVHRFYVPMVVH